MKLKEWKSRTSHKPLIIRGARQVGKTTLVRKFGSSFDHFIELNLEKDQDLKFFTFSDNVKTIFDAILLSKSMTFNHGKSYLLFIDEIQESPFAIQLLRYFYEDLPDIYLIAAGSLLEFSIGKVNSFPVGRVEQLMLYPLSFSEFLQTINKALLYEKWINIDINEFTHDLLLTEFKNYMVTGGMPEAIDQYIKDGYSFKSMSIIFESLWSTYLDDTLKYGKNENQKKVLQYLLKVAPYSMDRIQFSKLGQNLYKSREISEAIHQLQKAKILHLIYPVTSTTLPLLPDIKKRPRIQFLDTGLLLFINKNNVDFLINGTTNDGFRGQIYNHIVMQEMMALSNSVILEYFFWTRESSTANAEVDIVLPYKNLVLPIEVKSGATGSLRSLHEFMNRAPHDISIRLLSNKISIENVKTNKGKYFRLLNLPIYLAGNVYSALDKYGL